MKNTLVTYTLLALTLVSCYEARVEDHKLKEQLVIDRGNFCPKYKNEYQTFFEASPEEFCDKSEEILSKIEQEAISLGFDHHDISCMYAMVAPEVLRYSTVKDLMEVTSLECIYTEYGKQTVDFSIGLFQMKPSFIEYLETKSESLPKINRIQRIKQLKKLDWQIKYLCCTYSVLEEKYRHKRWTKEQKVKFYASAYNVGIAKSENEINRWIGIKVFPYGEPYGQSQCAYSDIAYLVYCSINPINYGK